MTWRRRSSSGTGEHPGQRDQFGPDVGAAGDVQVVTVQKNKVLPRAISLVGLIGAIVGGIFRSPAGMVCRTMLVVVGWLLALGRYRRTRRTASVEAATDETRDAPTGDPIDRTPA